jgi:hypothetical protein
MSDAAYPPTTDGIKRAIDSTDVLGWWEEKVDWSAELTPEERAERLALFALAQTVLQDRHLFEPQQILQIDAALRNAGMAITLAATCSPVDSGR